MSNDADENSNKYGTLLFTVEQQFRQLVLESKSNELIFKTAQENLNNSLKRNILLEHELETERLNKSMMKMELDTLTEMINNKNNNSEFDMNVLIKEREYLTNKIYKIQVENMELKQVLMKSNGQISSLLENQYKYPEKINLITLMLNSFQEQLKKLENESQTLVKVLCACNILAKKVLSAFQYSKQLNKTQFDHIQYLIKQLASIKSKIHVFFDQNEKTLMIQDDQTNRITSNYTDLEVYQKLVEILEVENSTLHKSIHQASKKYTVEDDAIEMTSEVNSNRI